MIQPTQLNFLEVHALNRFFVTLVFADLALMAKEMKMQVRLRPETEPVLTFSTDDASITKQQVAGKVEITLLKPASDMDIPIRNYVYDCWIWDADNLETVDTLLEGKFEVIKNITTI